MRAGEIFLRAVFNSIHPIPLFNGAFGLIGGLFMTNQVVGVWTTEKEAQEHATRIGGHISRSRPSTFTVSAGAAIQDVAESLPKRVTAKNGAPLPHIEDNRVTDRGSLPGPISGLPLPARPRIKRAKLYDAQPRPSRKAHNPRSE